MHQGQKQTWSSHTLPCSQSAEVLHKCLKGKQKFAEERSEFGGDWEILTEKKGSATRQRGMGERVFEGRICIKRKCEGTLMMGDRGVRGEEQEQEQEQEKKKRRRDLEGIAVLAWLPSGSVSGHFIHPASSTCFFGTGKDGSLPACPPICCIIIIISRTKFTGNQLWVLGFLFFFSCFWVV